MKHLTTLLLLSSLISHPSSLSAAVPLRWTVETSRAQPATFDEFAGATYGLEATLQSYGRPLEVVGEPHLYWQTNGMGTAYWTAPATVSGNVLRATWTPAYDVGARAYNCFIGITGTVYNAAFQLRLRPSPGALPNELPLPQKVIDFARVTVVNPPWQSPARPLPPYLHELSFDDTYPEDAAWYYAQPQDYGSCSAVRDGDFLYRNYDFPFDDRAEFVVRMSAGPGRFASIGVANCGTNLSEQIATSGKWSRYYRCLPGRTVDGINEYGVVAEVNVVGGPVTNGWKTTGSLHPLAAVRWVLDHAENAQDAANYLADNIRFPDGWSQNFHWMIADAAHGTYIVENGTVYAIPPYTMTAMTNFRLDPRDMSGEGQERYDALMAGASITSQWWTLTYTPSGYRPSDLQRVDSNVVFSAWANGSRESHRGEKLGGQSWWQTVHTSVYDLENRVLRLAVQETDDWYTFALNAPATKAELDSRRDLTNLTVYAVQEITEWVPDAHGQTLGLTGQPNIEWYGDENPGRFFCTWGDYISYDNGPEDETITFSHLESGDEFSAYKSVVGRTVIPTSDTLAKKSETVTPAELEAKRDLDDLAYVTTVPGGWTPTEVDGHRYDIYYDGYSGWHVEKLTYYPEWGEWYYEDSEFVGGPEDAETLVAHKIWSDETITFMRQQVEVQDSLALVSQIGNQAEIAAREYIQNNDIAKTKTLLRTGKPGEYGTGWGTMHYQFSSDRRWWSMIVPTLTASWSTGGYVGPDGNYVSASTVNFPGSSAYYLADPIGQRDRTPVARFVASSGTNGSARCSAATWSVGITAGPGTSSSSVRFDNSADVGSMPFLVTADVDHSAGFGRAVREDRSAVPAIEFDLQDYNRDHYVIGNFRYGEMTMTDRAVSVKCLYDVAVSNTYTRAVAQSTAWCTLNLGCSAESYITTNPDYGRVLTDTTRGLYYDPGLKATWRVAVTNGCFFTEIVSTNNVTEGVN